MDVNQVQLYNEDRMMMNRAYGKEAAKPSVFLDLTEDMLDSLPLYRAPASAPAAPPRVGASNSLDLVDDDMEIIVSKKRKREEEEDEIDRLLNLDDEDTKFLNKFIRTPSLPTQPNALDNPNNRIVNQNIRPFVNEKADKPTNVAAIVAPKLLEPPRPALFEEKKAPPPAPPAAAPKPLVPLAPVVEEKEKDPVVKQMIDAVLNVVSDASFGYVKELINRLKSEGKTKADEIPPNVINMLLDNPAYPKQGQIDSRSSHNIQIASPLKGYKDDNPNVECGCCAMEYPFEEFVQCNEGHLFCKNCLNSYVSNRVFGTGKVDIHCLDTDGCKAEFPPSMLKLALPEKTFEKYMQYRQDDELKQASLAGLIQCPFCDFKAIVDEPNVVTFICQNMECLKKSCIKCKRLDHSPKTCEQFEKEEKEKQTDSYRLRMEEAMTEARLRRCKHCNTVYVKNDGCNRIKCPTCPNVYICYVCQEHKIGYEHFCVCDRGYSIVAKCPKCGKCRLWLQDTEKLDEALVLQKREEELKKLQEEAKRQQVQLDPTKIGPNTLAGTKLGVPAYTIPAHAQVAARAAAAPRAARGRKKRRRY